MKFEWEHATVTIKCKGPDGVRFDMHGMAMCLGQIAVHIIEFDLVKFKGIYALTHIPTGYSIRSGYHSMGVAMLLAEKIVEECQNKGIVLGFDEPKDAPQVIKDIIADFEQGLQVITM